MVCMALEMFSGHKETPKLLWPNSFNTLLKSFRASFFQGQIASLCAPGERLYHFDQEQNQFAVTVFLAVRSKVPHVWTNNEHLYLVKPDKTTSAANLTKNSLAVKIICSITNWTNEIREN